MSRVNEIIENHKHLENLFSIIRHYGVNAEFISDCLLKEFEGRGSEQQPEQEQLPADQVFAQDIAEDLRQFSARF